MHFSSCQPFSLFFFEINPVIRKRACQVFFHLFLKINPVIILSGCQAFFLLFSKKIPAMEKSLSSLFLLFFKTNPATAFGGCQAFSSKKCRKDLCQAGEIPGCWKPARAREIQDFGQEKSASRDVDFAGVGTLLETARKCLISGKLWMENTMPMLIHSTIEESPQPPETRRLQELARFWRSWKNVSYPRKWGWKILCQHLAFLQSQNLSSLQKRGDCQHWHTSGSGQKVSHIWKKGGWRKLCQHREILQSLNLSSLQKHGDCRSWHTSENRSKSVPNVRKIKVSHI